MPTPETTAPTLRRDARENRNRILAAARAAFAAEGVDLPVEAIADRAGVGMGTLYRRFPTKPFAITEWGVESGDDPSFVRRLFAWVAAHPRCKMLVYYQDFGSSSTYRIQNYSASLSVLRTQLHSGLFPAYAPAFPRLPPPPPGGVAAQ